MRYRRRLRSRIIISFALFGTVLTALFAFSAVYLRERLENQLISKTLEKNVADYANSFRNDPNNTVITFSKIQGWVYSERKFANVPFAWQDLPNGVHALSEADGRGGKMVYRLAVKKDADYWFFLKYDTAQELESQERLLLAIIATFGVFALLSVILGIWAAGSVMQPVADLAQRLRALRGGAPDDRLADHYANDEVGQLAAALDDYRDRLTDLVERDREFNADVSHELRTPLAVIATTAELLLVSPAVTDKVRDRVKRIDRAVKQSTELTEALLLLSRRSREAPTDGETTDVARVTEQVIDTQRPNLGTKPVSVRLEVEEALEVVAPSSVVAVALANLVGNAFKYTPCGEVVVRVGDGKVIVEDSGPGIDAADAENLFQRGVRGKDASGKGAGLGLAIVRRLCELYDWHVSLRPRPQGGAAATLDFRLRR